MTTDLIHTDATGLAELNSVARVSTAHPAWAQDGRRPMRHRGSRGADQVQDRMPAGYALSLDVLSATGRPACICASEVNSRPRQRLSRIYGIGRGPGSRAKEPRRARRSARSDAPPRRAARS